MRRRRQRGRNERGRDEEVRRTFASFTNCDLDVSSVGNFRRIAVAGSNDCARAGQERTGQLDAEARQSAREQGDIARTTAAADRSEAEERIDDCAGRRSQAADGRVHDVDSSGPAGGSGRLAGIGVIYGGRGARRDGEAGERKDCARSGFAGSDPGREFAVWRELYVGERVWSDY